MLAWCESDRGVVAGTRDALYLPVPASEEGPGTTRRIPWEEVETADWDAEGSRLRVGEVGSWGLPRPRHELVLGEPRRLLELLRERVTASVVLQRHQPVTGTRGVRVIARRPAGGDRSLQWFLEYDPGIDPDDPVVADVVAQALAAARQDVDPG
ncbi:MAG TPA: hypothetical protein PLP61_00950 [Nocardioides sp.]|uniref:hypothetical protein n=1 Tax=Nocardioides sp. TaxID=35761 RepID=UPI002D1CF3BC|nr:hypothetical protein [Nocardioides sp.]HQR25580.1 hypothetical protein [Nocardioides sp.]